MSKRRERREDRHGFYSGPDEGTEARFHGYDASRRRNASVNPEMAPKKEVRAEAKATKKSGKVDLILAKAELATAKAQKRKWLVFILGFGIAIYFIMSSGGGLGIIEKVKSFVPFLGE
jgi:hypothetical protein